MKVFFIVFAILAGATALSFIIKIGKEKLMTSKSKPNAEVLEIKESSSPEKGGESSSDASENVSKQLTPEEVSAYENAAQKADAVQQQVGDGKLSAEEARDQLREIGKSIPVPPPPPAMKK